jgi:DNA-binding IclR family transcriptional regulator
MGFFGSIYTANLPHRARAVYMYLRDRADAKGCCWPSIRTIGRELGLSRSTVKRALNDLVAGGYLMKEPRYRENGSKSSSLYTVR